MPRLRRTLLAGILLMPLAACGRSGGRPSSSSSDSDPILFGTAGPWTEGYGQMNKHGMDLAVSDINAAGGVNGRHLELVSRDDGGGAVKATAIAEEFVANPRIVAVVGHVNSGAMVAAARVYDGHLAAVATTATAPDLTGVSPWVYRVISSDSTNGLDIARFAHRQLGHRRAAILYENNAYGRGLTEAFRRNFEGEIVSIDPIADDNRSFEPYVAFFKLRSPDVVFVAGTEGSGMALLREARRQGFRGDFVGGDGWTGVVRDTAASEGAYVGAPFSAEDPRPEAQKFVAAFRARYHADPDGNAAMAYDATMLLARAVAERGTDREAIRDYLATLAARGGYAGVTGTIRFQPNGDPLGRGFVMTRVHRGALLVADKGAP
ncbi:MAG TPA: ABC transporter substrate-binding protein [Gemmatimonadaceae bacterium]|nr:ABC transporter substrate-binding protein [Gemmatimonadaceae bacterium]